MDRTVWVSKHGGNEIFALRLKKEWIYTPTPICAYKTYHRVNLPFYLWMKGISEVSCMTAATNNIFHFCEGNYLKHVATYYM